MTFNSVPVVANPAAVGIVPSVTSIADGRVFCIHGHKWVAHYLHRAASWSFASWHNLLVGSARHQGYLTGVCGVICAGKVICTSKTA